MSNADDLLGVLYRFEINGTPLSRMPSLMGRIETYGELRAAEATKAQEEQRQYAETTRDDLLEALRELLDAYQVERNRLASSDITPADAQVAVAVKRRARAAIQKAEATS